jgi:hypothetical protein
MQVKPPKPMGAKDMVLGYGVTPGQIADPNKQRGVVWDPAQNTYVYADPSKVKPTHVAFSDTPIVMGQPVPKEVKVLPNEVVEKLRTPGVKTVPPPGQGLSGRSDAEMLDWANQHPDDPRSAAIKAKLGVQ